MVVKIQVEVFWFVMPCSVVLEYQCFKGCAASIFILRMESPWTFETLIFYHDSTWHHNSESLDFKCISARCESTRNLPDK
jgi:hypothetical protein